MKPLPSQTHLWHPPRTGEDKNHSVEILSPQFFPDLWVSHKPEQIRPLVVLFSSKQLPPASGALKVCLHILHHFRLQSCTSHRSSFSTFSLSHSKPRSLTCWKKKKRHTDKVIALRLSSVSKEPYGRYYYGAQKGKWQARCVALTFWWCTISENSYENITSVEWKSVQLKKSIPQRWNTVAEKDVMCWNGNGCKTNTNVHYFFLFLMQGLVDTAL